MRVLIFWLLALLAFAATPALAALPPRPDGPVLDQADILPPAQEAALDTQLRSVFDRTCRALIVVSVRSLDGEAIESFATKLGNEWHVGAPRTGHGVILLVAPTERKVRIEVSRSLRPTISNAVAKAIIDQRISPVFRKGDLAGGTLAGVDALITWLNSEHARATCSRSAA